MKIDREKREIEFGWPKWLAPVVFGVVALFWLGAGYVVVHFIAKYW
jgi:hypothetical protein